MFYLKPWAGMLRQEYILRLGMAGFANSSTNITNNSTCTQPDPIYWVIHYFDECLYNTKEEIGFILGLVSIVCWICSYLPQLIENYRNGNVEESLSFLFILFWLLGDSSNLVGCLLTHQFAFQTYTALYYVFIDLVALFQYLYYKCKHRKQHHRSEFVVIDGDATPQRTTNQVLCCLCLGVFVPLALTKFKFPAVNKYTTGERLGRKLLESSKGPPFFVWNAESITGQAIGYMSSILYLLSRLPQIHKNHKRGSTEGVSPIMFSLALVANLLYSLSILLQDPAAGETMGQFLIIHLPWLIGSLGTLGLDAFIMSQVIYFSKRCKKYRNIPVDNMVGEEDAMDGSDDDDERLLVV